MTQAPAAPKAARRRHDREIVALAVPAFGALVAEPLFLMADSAIVGHLGTAQLAGLGIASALLITAVSIFVFLAYATTAAVARRVGAGDLQAAIRQGMDGIWLALLLGAAVIAVVLPTAPALVELFGASDTAAPYATTYLRISALGIPAMLVVLAATGVLRGLQDTKTPLYVAIAGFVANAALNVALVYGADLGIAGSAWGTVIAQCGMAAVYLVVVVRGARKHGASLRPDAAGITGLRPGRRAAAGPHPLAAGDPDDRHRRRRPPRGRRYRRAPDHPVAVEPAGLRPRRHRHRRAGHHRPLSRRRTTPRAPATPAAAWCSGASPSASCSACWSSSAARCSCRCSPATRSSRTPHCPPCSSWPSPSRSAAIVFVLDGVLMGAGDGPYLAWAMLAHPGRLRPGGPARPRIRRRADRPLGSDDPDDDRADADPVAAHPLGPLDRHRRHALSNRSASRRVPVSRETTSILRRSPTTDSLCFT